jgi:sugar lactone lactonase YvrE
MSIYVVQRQLLGMVANLALAFGASAQGVIGTVAGGGPDGVPAMTANLNAPSSIATDADSNTYIVCWNRVFRVDPAGVLSVVAGTGAGAFSGDRGPATAASLRPFSVAVDTAGNLLIADTGNNRIRRVDRTSGIITTVAGDGTAGFSGDGGPATSASVASPFGLAIDAAGNLFIADTDNRRIRRVDGTTGIITTVAGDGTAGFSGDGLPATSASLAHPLGLAIDAAGNLFIADTDNHRIRRVDGTTGVIATVAGNGMTGFSGDGGPATSASLYFPGGVAVDAVGNLLILDRFNYRIRRVDGTTGVIATVAGSGMAGFAGDGGPATNASMSPGTGLAIDAAGHLLIADNNRIRRVDGTTGIITTVMGNGTHRFSGDGEPATSASLASPFGLAVDAVGNLFIADYDNNRIRRVGGTTGIITTVTGNGMASFSGDGGPAASATVAHSYGVAVDAVGNLFIADSGNSRIRRVDGTTGIITTVAGNGFPGFSGDGGPATGASLSFPSGVAVDAAGNLLIADFLNHRIRRVNGTTGIITTVAGNGIKAFSGDGGPATSASLILPFALAVDAAGNLFIADTYDHRIRRVDGTTGIITTVTGDGTANFSGDEGPATSATLAKPYGVAVDAVGNLFIADTGNSRIRRVDRTTDIITTVAGNGFPDFSGDGGPATGASLYFPTGVTVDAAGNLFIADADRIRQVSGL